LGENYCRLKRAPPGQNSLPKRRCDGRHSVGIVSWQDLRTRSGRCSSLQVGQRGWPKHLGTQLGAVL
jgi:hypothetical protein